MSLLTGLFYLFLFIRSSVFCEDIAHEEIGIDSSTEPNLLRDTDVKNEIERMIIKFEDVTTFDGSKQAVNSQDDIEKQYDEMIYILDEIIEAVKNSNNAHKFLKAKGIDRIASINLKIDYDELKTNILVLLKVLFDVAPTTTNAFIPIHVVDFILHIFENDNLALKAHALDVLFHWLPENPKVQARVMKLKGLEPFYDQISLLDTNVVKKLLDLFNRILIEHIKARNEGIGTADLKFYQRIGLLEHMSTPVVCNGLLNIFEQAWSYNSKDNNILMTVFELLTNVKPFCVNIYRGKTKAVKLFKVLEDYVGSPENKDLFAMHGLNLTEISSVIRDYVEKVRHLTKDEF